ncbi:hypothetical protein CISIN_1g026345mg [Citrus sinensis]|uniref:Alpha-1,4 glucan phosphorylase n=1 Tax=Citrus sinensis TaxID=2711 RepID=A0A067G4L9_CITSI|nr:hypothetical protein CISIN_1g026345mg [Citrus sinensis]
MKSKAYPLAKLPHPLLSPHRKALILVHGKALFPSLLLLTELDAALGNGGLERLASCFLDSLATLNYPAWDMDLDTNMACLNNSSLKMVRKKLQKVGGENVMDVAYDVPIPGYKTKTTLNLRLWSTKVAAEDFDLHAFNTGDHAKAYAAITNVEKICYVLYPGDEYIARKTLRLKQQYTLCSASVQDIIVRYEGRLGEPVNWENFPEKVAVQMNDTHPTLCIPDLIRILMDVKGLSWNDII